MGKVKFSTVQRPCLGAQRRLWDEGKVSTRTSHPSVGAQFLSKMESSGQPPASGKPAESGFLLPCRMPPQGCPAQQSPNVGLVGISTVHREQTERNMGNEKCSHKAGLIPFFKNPKTVDFLCFDGHMCLVWRKMAIVVF